MGRKKPPTIAELKKFKKKIEKKYKIKKVLMFGSVASGTYDENSDIDLIIVSDTFKGKSHLKRPIPFYKEWNFSFPVDFICYTLNEFNRLKKQISLVSMALKEGIEIV